MKAETMGRGIGAAIAAAALYAFVPNLARLAFERGIPALQTVTLRTIAAMVLMGAWALLAKQRFTIPAEARGSFVVQCLATLSISVCYLASLQFIPVSLSVIIFFTAPIIVLVLSPLLEGGSLSLRNCLMALTAFAGLAIALGPSFKQLNITGLGLAATAALGYAAQFFSGRKLGQYLQPQAMGSMVHLTILPPVVLIALWFGQGDVALFKPASLSNAWLLVVLTGLFYCAAYVMQMSAVKAAPASVVAPWFNLEPVITIGLALLLLGEKLEATHIAGGLIVLGVLLANAWLDRDDNGHLKRRSLKEAT